MSDSYGAAAIPARVEDQGSNWNPAQRIAFRFVFAYLVLYMIVGAPLGVILSIETQFGTAPGGKMLQRAIGIVWSPVVKWVGRFTHVSSSDWDSFGAVLLVAALAAGVWAALDWRPGREERRYRGLRDVVRYVLAFVLVLYGMDKVVPNAQFPVPALQTLVTPVGDMSVYPLFWASMGTSTMYAFFAGAMEVVAAVLLLFPRTMVLGALLSVSAMANVAMLNFGFDIPVKVFSFHLVLMSIFVLAGDFGRLVKALLKDRQRAGNWLRGILKAAFLFYILATSVQACLGIRGQRVNRSPLYGIYNVEEFTANGTVRPPLTTDAARWKTVIFARPGAIWIKSMDDEVESMPAEYDAAKGVLTISGKKKTDPKSAMSCALPDGQHLVLGGTLGGQALAVKLTRVDESKFKLVKSRVPWILDN